MEWFKHVKRDWADWQYECHMEGERARLWSFAWARMSEVVRSIHCKICGHKIVDCSSAGPEGGNMDYECSRCGAYWRRPLY